jgi:two-component system chemotaxis response regulator CheB
MTHLRPIDAYPDRSPKTVSRGGISLLASAGGIEATLGLLSALPANFALPIFLMQHLPADSPSLLAPLLQRRVALPVIWAQTGIVPCDGVIHVVPPGRMLEIDPAGLVMSQQPAGRRKWFYAVDLMLLSLARSYGARAIGVTLSGMLPVGLMGMRAIRREGGLTLAQSEGSAAHFDMPRAAIDFGQADMVYPPIRLAQALTLLAERFQS